MALSLRSITFLLPGVGWLVLALIGVGVIALDETLGRTGIWAAEPRVEEVVDDEEFNLVGAGLPEKGQTYLTITGDYTQQQAVWKRVEVTPGTELSKPQPLIAKLDPELGETGPEWAPVQ